MAKQQRWELDVDVEGNEVTADDIDSPNLWIRAGYLRAWAKKLPTSLDKEFLLKAERSLRAFAMMTDLENKMYINGVKLER